MPFPLPMTSALIAALLFTAPLMASAAPGKKPAAATPGVFDGYAGMRWGTDMHTVIKNFPGVVPSQKGGELVFRQDKPNSEISQRSFVFQGKKLVAVTVKFNADYVKKTGVEKLLRTHQKFYGKGTVDKSSGGHLVSHVWESPRTRITYAYAPKRPDMTAVLFQFKDRPMAPPQTTAPKASPPPAVMQPQMPPATKTPSLPAGHPPITGDKPIPAGPLNLPKGHPPIPGQPGSK